MRTWELLAVTTETPNEIRYRRYTESERKAEMFGRIAKIQFTDSGHGIVFAARELAPGEGRKAQVSHLLTHVEKALKSIRAIDKAA